MSSFELNKLSERTEFIADSDRLERGDNVHDEAFYLKLVRNNHDVNANIERITVDEKFFAICLTETNLTTATMKDQKFSRIKLFRSDKFDNKNGAIRDVLRSIPYYSSRSAVIYLAVVYSPSVNIFYNIPPGKYKATVDLLNTDFPDSYLNKDVYRIVNGVKNHEEIDSFNETELSALTPSFTPKDSLENIKLRFNNASLSLHLEATEINQIDSKTPNKTLRAESFIREMYNNSSRFIETTIEDVYKDQLTDKVIYSGSEAKAHPFRRVDEADDWEPTHESALVPEVLYPAESKA